MDTVNEMNLEKEKLTVYQKYYKDRFHNDAEYRERFKGYIKKWKDTHKEMFESEDFKEKNREKVKKCYESNPEYREKQKQRALERYYRLKAEREMAKVASTTD